ncbi:MAG: hypothetical protein GY859_38295, partial [Desulfobacterales bacterium]|nr:hypothetical protein [Desulfobacterales bacterium]
MERENIDASGPTGWGPFRFISDRIQNKILVAFLALAIIPLLALVVIAYFTSTDALMKRSYTSLEGVRSMKANIIQDYFFERQTDLVAVTDAVRTLRQQAADKLTTVMNIKKERIERYFNERAANLSILAANPAVINAMAAFENAPGAAGGEEWQKAARVHGGFFKKVREISGHRDILLASSGGKILFSVDQASDPGKNLKTGALKESPAGRAFTRGLAGVVIEDFGKRADGEMSAFIAAPVKAADRTLGVVMAEISIDRIDAIMA